jgi:Zn-finger nucleic acid-binding protein
MQCPIDGANLIMTDRNGVEIDYCPTCRGVWLDRGELDKIIERASGNVAPAPRRETQHDDRKYDDRSRGYDKRKKKSKAGSLLGELFDF